ncbi:hypothetical protein [Micromonospora maritima]|uniref:hypothetical protein n=1 Tax=Micromonospora maritima TaxID=986711 RepID=UPI00157CEB6C|nr:hypothetical protein [Micromonospora maritima]
MEAFAAFLLIAASFCAVLRGFGFGKAKADGGFDLGWIAVALFITGAFTLPAVAASS